MNHAPDIKNERIIFIGKFGNGAASFHAGVCKAKSSNSQMLRLDLQLYQYICIYKYTDIVHADILLANRSAELKKMILRS